MSATVSIPAPGGDFARFLLHTGVFNFAANLAGVFFIAFMLKQGVPPVAIFLSIAAIFALRFVMRPLVIVLAKGLGLRGAMAVGTVLSCTQYYALAQLRGVDLWLVALVITISIGDVIYWTLFHVMFAAIGARSKLGRATSLRQFVFAGASITAPPIGGLLLTWFDPSIAFAIAAVLRMASVLPLLGVTDPPFPREPPAGAYRAGAFGAYIFMMDAWVICGAGTAWAMICFTGLGERFDTLGAALATASAFGAFGGFFIGKLVDLGHARRAVLINLSAGAAVLLFEATAGGRPALIVTAMIVSALVGGLAAPAVMPIVYSSVQTAPCPLRFQFSTEGGFDCGAVGASLAGAAVVWSGAPLWATILMSIPAVFMQASLLIGKYKSRAQAFAAGN